MGKRSSEAPVPLRRRRRVKPVQPRPAEKVELGGAAAEEAGVVPARVRIEVEGGRDATATVLRAVRLLHKIEGTGGVATIAELAPGRSALHAEVDGAQAESLARLPFVRRIYTLN